MSDRPDPDRPLPSSDAFNVDAHVFMAPREDPAANPRPPANGELDEDALRRAAAALARIVG